MSGRQPLFVRIPSRHAERLDRAAFELKASKQDLIAGLVARYVDPASAEGLESLRALTGSLDVGRHEFRAGAPPDATEILTLEEAAELLRLGPAAARAAAEAGEIPGRCIGGRWRFSRRRLIDWIEGASD